jgi:hypothetical protein
MARVTRKTGPFDFLAHTGLAWVCLQIQAASVKEYCDLKVFRIKKTSGSSLDRHNLAIWTGGDCISGLMTTIIHYMG